MIVGILTSADDPVACGWTTSNYVPQATSAYALGKVSQAGLRLVDRPARRRAGAVKAVAVRIVKIPVIMNLMP